MNFASLFLRKEAYGPIIPPLSSSRQALPRFLALYVALQPLLDVLTSLATQAEISLTAGTVVRTLFVGFAFLYTVFCGPFPGRKALLSYLGLLTGYLAVFGLWSLVRGGMSACIVNLSEALKTFYFPYTAAFLYAIYRQKRWIVPGLGCGCRRAWICPESFSWPASPAPAFTATMPDMATAAGFMRQMM